MLYIHIPFCVRKCAYCDFLSFAVAEEEKENYLAALSREIRSVAETYADYTVSSIFIGGGTPSLLTGPEIGGLMEILRSHFTIGKMAEITMECNPGTLTSEKVRVYKAAGVNRISLGLQSANDEELKLLGRIHSYEDFQHSFQIVREAGFTNINVDLMEGLPGQNKETFLRSLEKVMALQPEHISMYSLMVEPGTPFYERYGENGPLENDLPSEEEERQTYYEARELLEAAGYQQYEISNFARNGFHCRHNKGYWERKDYLGLGLGAASLVNQKRFRNTSSLAVYINGKTCYEDVQELSVKEQMEEFMFLGLRKTSGVITEKFIKLYNRSVEEVYGSWISQMQKEELLVKKEGRLFLTYKGMDLSNYVFQGFLLD